MTTCDWRVHKNMNVSSTKKSALTAKNSSSKHTKKFYWRNVKLKRTSSMDVDSRSTRETDLHRTTGTS